MWLLITTRGDKGTSDPDADVEALARVRVEETAKAAALLGFEGHFHLDHPDGELHDDKELRARVRLDTPREREYLRHGGILRFVLRRLLST